jgi:hypothetical protein
MTGLPVTLDFSCCGCEEPVSVTVVCQGGGWSGKTAGGVAAVNVPCPACSEINQVFFETNGTLHGVRRLQPRLTMPVPSIN